MSTGGWIRADPRRLRLVALSLAHAVVDHYATFLSPIYLILAAHTGLPQAQGAVLVSLAVFINSFTQPFFGLWSDRRGSRVLVLAGPALVGLAYGHLLEIHSLPVLLLAICLGALAISAFHPAAALAAQACGSPGSSAALSLFVAAGPLGFVLGPAVIALAADGQIAAWVLPLAGVGTSLMLWVSFPGSPRAQARKRPPLGLLEAFRGRWIEVGKLVVVSAVRAFVSTGLSAGFALLLCERMGGLEAALPAIGWWNSVFLGCTALGGLACSFWVRRHQERVAVVGSYLLALPWLAWLPFSSGPGCWVALSMGGLLLGATNPLVVALGQRMVPGGAGLASALLMGLSWGLGGTLSPLLVSWLSAQTGTPLAIGLLSLALLPGAAAGYLLSPGLFAAGEEKA